MCHGFLFDRQADILDAAHRGCVVNRKGTSMDQEAVPFFVMPKGNRSCIVETEMAAADGVIQVSHSIVDPDGVRLPYEEYGIQNPDSDPRLVGVRAWNIVVEYLEGDGVLHTVYPLGTSHSNVRAHRVTVLPKER